MSSSPGRSNRPPSHPHAASNAAAPPPTPSVTNARLAMPCGLASVMARESPPVQTGEHSAQRRGIHGEHEDVAQDGEPGIHPHEQAEAVARRLLTRSKS